MTRSRRVWRGIITQVQAATKAIDERDDLERHLDHAARLARERFTAARRSMRAAVAGALETARLPDPLAPSVATAPEAMHLNGGTGLAPRRT